jgi:hypothetical protein
MKNELNNVKANLSLLPTGSQSRSSSQYQTTFP